MKRGLLLNSVLILSSAAAGACGSSTANQTADAGVDSTPVDTGTSATTDAAAETTDETEAGKPLAPTNLRSFETTAEGVSDQCKVADYTKASNVLGEATKTWTALKPQVQAAGAPAALVKKIDDELATLVTDISSKAQKACETDANVITLAVPDMFDLFTWTVPSDALRGDGVFRQLQIDGEYSDWTRGPADLKATKDVWARLKPLAAAKAPTRTDIPGASTVVADMDKAIADCETAIGAHDSAGLQTAAQNGLDAIDVVETIFK